MLYAAFSMRYTADTSNGIPNGLSRLTVPEAAKVLGISPEAVRNRLSRGTLDSIRMSGMVYVLLPTDRPRHTDDIPNGTPKDIPIDISGVFGQGSRPALISAKDETIRVLENQLEAEREASAELRRIIAGLVQRVPELEAPPESRESPETATNLHQGGGGHPQGDDAGRETTKSRSLWRRIFGT